MFEPTDRTEQTERPVVPIEYSGKWVLWSRDGKRIVAAGETVEEAEQAVKTGGETDVIYEWVPPADAGFLGATGCASHT